MADMSDAEKCFGPDSLIGKEIRRIREEEKLMHDLTLIEKLRQIANAESGAS